MRRVFGRETPPSEGRFAAAWWRVAAATFGPGGDSNEVETARASDAVRIIRRSRAIAALGERLAHGESIESAVCAVVRLLAATGDWRDLNTAWAIAEGIGRAPEGSRARALGHALLRHRQGQLDRVWTQLRELPDEVLRRFVPIEAVDGALAAGTDGRDRALTIASPATSLPDGVLVDLAGRFMAVGERDRADHLLAELRRRPVPDLDESRRASRAWMERSMERPPAKPSADSVRIAVLDFRTPDSRVSAGNLGEYIQELAVLANIGRYTNVTFTGDDGLGAFATALQSAIPPEKRLPTFSGAAHLTAVPRDFTSGEQIEEPTWLFAIGRHMAPLFGLRTDFPYHPNVRPLFLSVHVSHVEAMTAEALAYLRRYGPVGCRDWTTVFVLLAAGVDAFFSGCVTTTLDLLYRRREFGTTGAERVGTIDPPPGTRRLGDESSQYTHELAAPFATVADGLAAAQDRLGEYLRSCSRVVTGRLTAYLALTALGVPVEFIAQPTGDPRLGGLVGLESEPDRLADMQSGIRDLVAVAMETIIQGSPEEDVYARWRELTEGRVAEARHRFQAAGVEPTATLDIASAIEKSWTDRQQFGPHGEIDPARVTDFVLALDQNLMWPTAVLLESIVTNASGSLRAWILGRGLPGEYRSWLAGAFPSLPLTFVPCDDIAYSVDGGRPKRIPARITISTMDRLLLPIMLGDVSRAVYLDIDTLVLGDICQLARTDLEGHPIGARHSTVSEASEWLRAARPLPERDATELRRMVLKAHAFGHPALNAGVLVLDLDRMRRDDFSRRFIAWVERFGLNDQDAMLAYAGPDRRVLDPAWNALPHLEDVHEPKVIHWTSLGKPWEEELTYAKDVWQGYADKVRKRAGLPPVGGRVH